MGPDAATLQRQRRRVLISSYIGSVIEWLDFYLYTIAAASVFSVVFFPTKDPLIGTIASFGTLAVAYVVRPLGGLVYGYFGDRLGRKRMLVSSILLMGVSTVLVGALPGYAQIGVLAPILLVLLRICQGIAVAGEWGGAVLMALEHASPRRRGLWSCFTGMGISTGLLLASGCFALLARLPQDQFLAWGWRLPFLLASVLIGIGLWVRLGIEESPVFLEDQARRASLATQRSAMAPAAAGWQWDQVLLAFLLTVGPFAISGIKTAFLVSYAIGVGLPRDVTLTATTVSSVVSVFCMLIGGWASDLFGRKVVVVAGGVMLATVCFFVFDIIDQKSAGLLMLAMCLVTGTHGIMYGPLGAFIAELFPTRSRYTGASLSYQLAGVVGGFAPLIATILQQAGGGQANVHYVIAFMVACPVVGILAALYARETAWTDLRQPSQDGAAQPLASQDSARLPAGSI